VGVDASNFQFYSGGVMTADSCGTKLNHAVTAVGYGTAEDGGRYWLIKNQWGENWGEGGCLRLEKGANACGVASKDRDFRKIPLKGFAPVKYHRNLKL
jgi:C1A family cysteine protease